MHDVSMCKVITATSSLRHVYVLCDVVKCTNKFGALCALCVRDFVICSPSRQSVRLSLNI